MGQEGCVWIVLGLVVFFYLSACGLHVMTPTLWPTPITFEASPPMNLSLRAAADATAA